MKKLLIAALALALFTPALAMAQTTPTATTTATPAATTVTKAAKTKIAAAKQGTGLKNCDPKKSKPCGKACIPLARTCHK